MKLVIITIIIIMITIIIQLITLILGLLWLPDGAQDGHANDRNAFSLFFGEGGTHDDTRESEDDRKI